MFYKLFAVLLMLIPVFTEASTIDDIARLEVAKERAGASPATDTQSTPQQTTPSRTVWYQLGNGQRVDVGNWLIVHFIRSDCPYCHRFNPILKSVSEQTGIDVFVYSFDGKGDNTFPKVMPVNDSVLKDFFAELPQATPTDFVINTQSLVTIPLSQGEMSAEALKQRLDESFALAVRLGVL
ncbi:type-F conjugative transfer system pilin assembly thiol-disulfide isomerase TrbB [Mixta intestinalis]|uniref:Thioredoxin domain-containing protein n=1 Tax=Mixta intestinalis TaxID=1615494 RepID=A0A6P1Q7G0_9GAMM|nr:type-F conjugative transfer system pilin assembly thiol-disulfide isomerase TrbB [Mixta intestinalis]QHM74019.1 hypothetical protein C7M51_04380 [Mixta intestinalis]